MHLDHGLELINTFFEENSNFSGFEFLLDNIELGIEEMENVDDRFEFSRNNNFYNREQLPEEIRESKMTHLTMKYLLMMDWATIKLLNPKAHELHLKIRLKI